MPQIRIVLADDHPLFLQGLAALLEREQDFSVAASFTNGADVVNFLSKENADVVILDVSMPQMDGIATVKSIREKKFIARIIMLTTFNDIEFVKALTSFDIGGYVLKNSTGEELVQAIRKVLLGETWFSPEVKQAMAADVLQAEQKKKSPATLLTTRETEIVQLLAKEMTNDEIADKLFISFRTVETHRKNIMQKTGAKNLAGLITYAMSNGILK